jgi:hypothetical protein
MTIFLTVMFVVALAVLVAGGIWHLFDESPGGATENKK